MAVDEALIKAAMPLARVMSDPDTRRKVQRAIDNTGHVILDGRDFIPLRSPNGTIFRLRVDDTGTLTTTEEA